MYSRNVPCLSFQYPTQPQLHASNLIRYIHLYTNKKDFLIIIYYASVGSHIPLLIINMQEAINCDINILLRSNQNSQLHLLQVRHPHRINGISINNRRPWKQERGGCIIDSVIQIYKALSHKSQKQSNIFHQIQ